MKATKFNAAVHVVLAEVSDDGDRVNLFFTYHPARVKKARNIPGWKFVSAEKGGPLWRFPLDLATCRKLREEYGNELTLGDRLKDWGHTEVEKESKLTELSQANDAKLKRLPKKLLNWLRPYQRADIQFMASTNVLNTNQPRTGKTPETIGAVIEAELEWGCHLVIAPVTSLQNVWERQIKKVYAEAGLDEPTILSGMNPTERKAAVKEAKELADEGASFWLLLNPYSVQLRRHKVEGTSGDGIKFEEELVEPALAEIDWDTFTIDEFHLMGLGNIATNGHRGCLFIREATQPDRCFALSGTPMGGKPIKLFGALRFLDPPAFPSKWNWARHWLVINNEGYGNNIEGIMPGREVDFYDHLKPYLVRRTRREEMPGLPDEVIEDVWCEMGPKQAAQYRQFAQEAEWKLDEDEEGGRLTASNILAQYTRLKQFASAFSKVYRKANDEIEVTATEDSAKFEALMAKLDELGVTDPDGDAKAVVGSQFRSMVKMVADALNEKGICAEFIRGGQSQKDRNRIQDEFQGLVERADGQTLRVVVLNTKAGGTAITLDAADNIHVLDETWVPDDQEQLRDRIVPTNDEVAKRRTTTGIYYYRTKGTIEEYIQKLVADKEMNNRTILDLRRRMQQEAAKLEAKTAK